MKVPKQLVQILAFLLYGLPSAAEVVSISDLFASIDRYFPRIQAEQRKAEAANERLRASRGAFDPVFRYESSRYGGGEYNGRYHQGLLDVPLRFNGGQVTTGYRSSTGSFPEYDDVRATGDSGELFAGVRIALLRGFAVDERRTAEKEALLLAEIANLEVQAQKLQVRRDGLQALMRLAASERKLEIAKELLQVAQQRESQVQAQVRLGAIPNIELIENQRLLSARLSDVYLAEGSYNQDLEFASLFYRTNEGEPHQSRFTVSVLPVKKITVETLDEFRNLFLQQRPEIKALNLGIDRLRIAQDLANNEVLPSITLGGELSQDSGGGEDRSEGTEGKIKLNLEVPLFQQQARGRRAAVGLEMQAAKETLRLKIDTMTAELEGAWQQYSAVVKGYTVAEQEVVFAQQLERAERERVRRGDSNLLFLNIREGQLAEAKIKLVETQIKKRELEEGLFILAGVVD